MKRTLYLLSILAFIVGCESSNEIAFKPQIVVQGFLYANEPLDSIIVRTTQSVFDTNRDMSVSGALVTIEGNARIDTLHEGQIHGQYRTSLLLIPRSRETYTLRVQWKDQVATSTTTIPDSIHLDSVVAYGRRLSLTDDDSIPFPDRNSIDSLNKPGIHLYWSKSENAAGYGVEALCIDTARHTRFTYDTVGDSIHTYSYDSGGRINAKVSFDDTTSFGRYRFFILSTDEQVAWLQFLFYGSNVVRALAIDKNYQDYILSLYISRSQYNNSTLHVQGGLGVFGSAARASKKVFLE